MKKGTHVMVRTYSAGVFAGQYVRHTNAICELKNARRIWKWSGAASLSQLAMEGTSDPANCMFPCAVDRIILNGWIEIVPMTAAAIKSINEVPVWKK